MTFIVAVDGPAGSGKSSVSKAVARELGLGYLDTGAAYRVLTLACLSAGVNRDDEGEVLGVLEGIHYDAPTSPDNQVFVVDGVDVSEAIRTEHTSAHVSAIAKHQRVRSVLNDGFRALVASHDNGLIIEGRDITTVVAPDAPVRVLLTADEATRIARRQSEQGGVDASALSARDQADRQVVDFMTAAPGVQTIDSTLLSFEDTVAALRELVVSHLRAKGERS